MKILNKITSSIIIILIIFSLTISTQINISASLNVYSNSRKIANVSVLLPSFEDLYFQQFKQSLENIQNADKVKFTFFDGKNNASIQNEIIDSELRNNIDLLIAVLVNPNENSVNNAIFKAKQSNVPLMILNSDPQIVSKIPETYDKYKVAFVLPTASQSGTIEGNILVNLWNTNKSVIDKNGDDILQYVVLQGDNQQAIERTQKAISAINDSGIKTQQLQLIGADWFEDIAKTAIQSSFLRFGNNIEAIISNNDAMAIGAIEALQSYGYNITTGNQSKYIPVVGIDGIPQARDLVDKGLMAGTVILDSKLLAEAVYTISKNMINNVDPIENTNYKYIDGQISVPFAVNEYINKSNIP